LIAKGGVPKIVDFGLARATGHMDAATHSTFAGTRGYIAPEVARAGRVDFRADIFSLGITLYEAAVGKRRKAQEDPTAPVELSFPDGFPASAARLLVSMVAGEPARRPGSYEALMGGAGGVLTPPARD